MNIEITDKGRAEYDALVRDAKRYRWLRQDARTVEIEAPLVFMANDHAAPGVILEWRALDAAIDAAMEASHE